MSGQDEAKAIGDSIRASIRAACGPCGGTGIAGQDGQGDAIECEYCGRPMLAVDDNAIASALASRGGVRVVRVIHSNPHGLAFSTPMGNLEAGQYIAVVENPPPQPATEGPVCDCGKIEHGRHHSHCPVMQQRRSPTAQRGPGDGDERYVIGEGYGVGKGILNDGDHVGAFAWVGLTTEPGGGIAEPLTFPSEKLSRIVGGKLTSDKPRRKFRLVLEVVEAALAAKETP